MLQRKKESGPRVVLSCYVNMSRSGEQFVSNHALSYVISGGYDIYLNGKTQSFKAGDFRFIAKDQLAKFTKYPPANGEFKSISLVFDQSTLREISEENDLHKQKAYTGETLIHLQPTVLLQTFIDSLYPYLNNSGEINSIVAKLKSKEAIMILLETKPELRNLLFDFTTPGKIDLKAYMIQNFKFNVGLSEYAYLTGRSLATFKRDFEQIFSTSPNKWLQQRRLEEAYFLIKVQGRKVTDVYIDAGFKDLSHFSFAFKKAYGIAPSKLTLTI